VNPAGRSLLFRDAHWRSGVAEVMTRLDTHPFIAGFF
jgi:hypothetical protein